MRKLLISILVVFIIVITVQNTAHSQNYTLRQSNGMMGMNTESTVYVKGMRKRTEGKGIMGMGASIVTIEQCDLQRTVKLNDKKKLYVIIPFEQVNEQVIDDDAVNAKKPVTLPKQTKPDTIRKGGIITTWYSIIDTGERKQIYGFTARHVWTSNKMKPSADACYMKDSMLIKTDGWYIDLPQFNCPVHRTVAPRQPNEKPKPDCRDQYVSHRRGKGKLGFPLTETTTIVMGSGSEINTSIETVELSTARLDSMLFEIPPGYTEAKSEEDLQEKLDVKDIMKDAMKNYSENVNNQAKTETKKAGIIRIGVFAPSGDEQVQSAMLQQHMVTTLTTGKVEAIAVSNEEEARKYNCDYTLGSAFSKIKSASKLGGILKAIKNTDPNAASNFNIQAGLTLKAMSDGAVKSEPKVDGKYEGNVNDAAGKALDDGCSQVLKALK